MQLTRLRMPFDFLRAFSAIFYYLLDVANGHFNTVPAFIFYSRRALFTYAAGRDAIA